MHILFVQLPIPKQNLGLQTGNVPLAAAVLKLAARDLPLYESISILPESISSYIGDQAMIDLILSMNPDLVMFSLFCWNAERSFFIAERLNSNGIRIAFGGPEVTKDNPFLKENIADFCVFGEGESFFRRFAGSLGAKDNCGIFMDMDSPYIHGLLEPEIENSIMLETQRGCPYSCGYCYYNKSRKGLCFKPMEKVLSGVEYALEKDISEVYFLDPSLNARPDLEGMLKSLVDLNKDGKIDFHSEIRAEAITPKLADLFQKSGFKSFEIGLQSVNPKALKIMRRPTNISKFLEGVALLKERGISPCIDLIAGLPGDTPDGLKASIDFIVENNLVGDLQFFPLCVIPGTDFRINSESLGLNYNPFPPYNIISTRTFSDEDLVEAFIYAESALDTSFSPMPDLELSYDNGRGGDLFVKIGDLEYVSKVIVKSIRPLDELEKIALNVTSPYQIFFFSEIQDKDYVRRVCSLFTSLNPFVPLEVVFIDSIFGSSSVFLDACRIKRPHFLDGDMRYLHESPGNRAVVFTFASSYGGLELPGEMENNVLIWNRERLPYPEELMQMDAYDGLLVEGPVDSVLIEEWQKKILPQYEDLLHISFASVKDNIRWLKMINPGTYWLDFFDGYKV